MGLRTQVGIVLVHELRQMDRTAQGNDVPAL